MNEDLAHRRLRAIWPDHLGIARSKMLPLTEERLASGQAGTYVVTTFGLAHDRAIRDVPGSYTSEGLRDMTATFESADLRPCWNDERTAVVVCDLVLDGGLLPVAPRTALRGAIARWERLGLKPVVGVELEGYLLEPDGSGGWSRSNPSGSFVYDTGPASDPQGFVDAVWWAAERSGIPLAAVNAEFDAGQFEFTLEHRDALRAADDAFLCRQLVREIALRRGLAFTFLGQPFDGVSGSGFHTNVSLVNAAGANVLADDASPDGLSPAAHHAIAGLVNHHRGLVALSAPNINAYRRLRPGHLAGYWANWGYDHRLATNRVPIARGEATRIENRAADGAANAHLAVATVLQAAWLGLRDERPLPPALTGDGFEDGGTTIHAAANLASALDDLEADHDLVEAVGADLVANFLANGRAEWNDFTSAVEESDREAITAWERSRYVPYH